MTKPIRFPATCLLSLAFFLAFSLAPLSAADDEALKKDLTAVIALHGLPCGVVVAVMVRAERVVVEAIKP